MKKKRLRKAQSRGIGKPLPWFPIDTRLFPPIFSFSHVRGVPRFFLQLEIILATSVVIGTLVIALLKLLLTVLEQ